MFFCSSLVPRSACLPHKLFNTTSVDARHHGASLSEQYRGGVGISKVVKPSQIKDHSCMWKGGVYNRQCAAVKATCGIKMRGCRCILVGPRRAPDPPVVSHIILVHAML